MKWTVEALYGWNLSLARLKITFWFCVIVKNLNLIFWRMRMGTIWYRRVLNWFKRTETVLNKPFWFISHDWDRIMFKVCLILYNSESYCSVMLRRASMIFTVNGSPMESGNELCVIDRVKFRVNARTSHFLKCLPCYWTIPYRYHVVPKSKNHWISPCHAL